MKNVLIVLFIVSLSAIGCSSRNTNIVNNAPSYTTIKQGTDFSLFKHIVVSPTNEDPIRIKSEIERSLINLGFDVVDKQVNVAPDMVVRFDYFHYYKRDFWYNAVWYVDNLHISFVDNKTGTILLTSKYPRLFYQHFANKTVQRMFDDIQKAMTIRK